MSKWTDIEQHQKDICIEALAALLPDHWELVETNSKGDGYYDDGRDYTVPFFRRKESSDGEDYRIYINDGAWFTEHMFGVILADDGDCFEANRFLQAIKLCDQRAITNVLK